MRISKLSHAILIPILVLIASCSPELDKKKKGKMDQYSYDLGVVAGFCEMINAGVKKLALSAPMSRQKMDEFMVDAEKIAARHDVLIYREDDLLKTYLFPDDIVKDKEVLLLYQGNTKAEYLRLKADNLKLTESGASQELARINIARRFGRMLSYSPRKINQLMAQNTSFRTMDDFGILASNLFLYYKDLKAASRFYENILGLELLASYDNAEIFRVAGDSYLILVDAAKGMHTATEPKTVALALLTDQLDEWYIFLRDQGVQIKYDYNPKEGGAHDGFVAIDPEGYLLEFERFKEHPENEQFLPILNQNKTIKSPPNQKTLVPEGLGFHSTITWLYYKDVLAMQKFYEDVLGLQIVADQGWAKIYQVTNTGFIGLVDERRGMHHFTEKKAVNVSFILNDLEGWFDYVETNRPFELRSDQISTGPENRYKGFIGYDPEGYFMEFDIFYSHDDNRTLMEYLDDE